jgi:hypothetical protein
VTPSLLRRRRCPSAFPTFPVHLRPDAIVPLSDVPLQDVAAQVAAGQIEAAPSRVFSFSEIHDAHRVMEAGGKWLSSSNRLIINRSIYAVILGRHKAATLVS